MESATLVPLRPPPKLKLPRHTPIGRLQLKCSSSPAPFQALQLPSDARLVAPKLPSPPAPPQTLQLLLKMPVASMAASVVTKSVAASLAPLVLTSAAVTTYARYASHHPLQSGDTRDEQRESAHQAELLHQHVVAPWKGTR